MKTRINYLLVLIMSCATLTQISAQSFEYLDINDVRARINVNDFIFNDPTNGLPSYEYPKNSGKNTVFAANLMVLGLDLSSQLYGMVPQINNSTDLYAGPIMNPSEYATSAQIWDRVWKINCSTIQTFKDWYQAGVDDAANGTSTQLSNFPGYVIPQSILDWPAHGDVSKGQAFIIAPFFDYDSDGFYNPASGDYPLIKGDQAIFFVYNNERPLWSIAPNKMEVRVMAYAYGNTLDSALNSTTFLSYEIINRSTITLNNVYIGLDTDLDIGGSSDDFIGSDVARSSFYGYNGDSFDADANGILGYGNNLAAQSIVFLNGPFLDNDGIDNPLTPIIQDVLDSNGSAYPCTGMGFGDGIVDNETFGLENFMQYDNFGGPQGFPSSGVDFYNYLRGVWKDGSQLVYGGNGHFSGGGTVPANYIYSGNSDPLFYSTSGVTATPLSWSESGTGNPPGDRKGIGSMGPYTLQPGAVNRIDFALVSAVDYTGSGPQASLTIMNERVDSIRSYFCNGLVSNCASGPFTTAIKTHTQNQSNMVIAPNPFTNQFSFSYELENESATLLIFNLLGEQIMSQTITQKTTTLNLSQHPNGVYFVTIVDGINRVSKKVIKN